jgi:hypothetical protein
MVERFRPRPDNITALPHKPLGNAERQKRHRDKRKAAKEAAVMPAVMATVMPMPRRDGVTFSTITLAAAFGVATVSASFGIFGLTRVFSGAFWSVIAMGVALECAKLAGVAWLGRNRVGPLWIVITALVTVLMALSAIGSFGFLSSAHISHIAFHRAEVDLRAADVEARSKVQGAVLADINARVSLIDAGIGETIRRGRAVAAMALADQQKRNRADLLLERGAVAQKLAAIEIEAVKVQADRAELAVDDGPILYLSELFGAAMDDVMRWFIALVSVLLDPLACVLLLAATAQRGTS